MKRSKTTGVEVELQRLVDAVANFEANPNGVGTVAWCELGRALLAYESTGDHDHSMRGNRPIPPGARCPGGDCWVSRARKLVVEGSTVGLEEYKHPIGSCYVRPFGHHKTVKPCGDPRCAAADPEVKPDKKTIELVRRLVNVLGLCDLAEEGANDLTEEESTEAVNVELEARAFLEKHRKVQEPKPNVAQAPSQCTHIFRSGPLHPSIKVGGMVSLGRCENECFPELVVCFDHASKDALAMVARNAIHKLERSKG